jgi:hypothetical protein
MSAYVALLNGCVLGFAASSSGSTSAPEGLQLQLQPLWQVAPMEVPLAPVQVTAPHSSPVPVFSTPVLVAYPPQPAAAADHVGRGSTSNQQGASGARSPGVAGTSDGSTNHALAAPPHPGTEHLLLVAGVDGQVAAITTADGKLVWRTHLGSHVFADLAALPQAPGAGMDASSSGGTCGWQQVLAATQNGELVSLDSSSGTEVGGWCSGVCTMAFALLTRHTKMPIGRQQRCAELLLVWHAQNECCRRFLHVPSRVCCRLVPHQALVAGTS